MSSEVIGVIAAQLASAIAHVHSHGLVLISLSPQNAVIQMGRPGGIPVVKITDVKLAECSKGDWQYNKGVKLRSQGYIAPEVLAGKRPTGIGNASCICTFITTFLLPQIQHCCAYWCLPFCMHMGRTT